MLKIGMWLCTGVDTSGVTPESLDLEERQLQEAAQDFVDSRLMPQMEAIESPDFTLHRSLLSEAGELGFLGLLVPQAYGGAEQSLLTTALIMERLALGGGVGVSIMAHSGIGTLPLVLFGSDYQRQRYLPVLAAGRWISAFALTEPDAGSDALAIRTTATRCEGGWRLSGQKQFITNGGLADLYTVFARTGTEGLAAFLVERTSPGLSLGPEEHKMGLAGSSTRRLTLDGVMVPDARLLGRSGRGQAIAFAVLHFTRFMMASGCLGLAKRALSLAADYAGKRQQFGRPLAAMGLVREKLAQMATRVYALESALYRLGGWLGQPGRERSPFALECSALKVFASEVAGYCADEAVQVHGGSGYIRGCEAERLYRDVRIQRIFEGTNEINRLIVARRALRFAKSLSLPAAVGKARLVRGRGPEDTVRAIKDVALHLACAASRSTATEGDGEEVLARVADATIAAFVADSSWARASRHGLEQHRDLAALAVESAWETALRCAREVYGTLLPEAEAARAWEAARRLSPDVVTDPIGLRARIAQRLVGAVAAENPAGWQDGSPELGAAAL